MVIAAGFQLPVTPFNEVPGNAAGVVPWQYGPSAAKVGVTGAFTTTLIAVVVAQKPVPGVKV